MKPKILDNYSNNDYPYEIFFPRKYSPVNSLSSPGEQVSKKMFPQFGAVATDQAEVKVLIEEISIKIKYHLNKNLQTIKILHLVQ